MSVAVVATRDGITDQEETVATSVAAANEGAIAEAADTEPTAGEKQLEGAMPALPTEQDVAGPVAGGNGDNKHGDEEGEKGGGEGDEVAAETTANDA